MVLSVVWESVAGVVGNVWRLQVQGGWLVTVNGTSLIFMPDPTYAWGVVAAPTTSAPVTSAPVTSAPVTTAPVTTTPTTAAPVTTAPVTPAPITQAPVTTAPTTTAPVTPLSYIYQNGLQNAWRDYTWATEAFVSDTMGTKAIKATMGPYTAVSFNNANDAPIASQNYLGIQFDILSDGKQSVSVAVYTDQTQVANKMIVPPATKTTMTVLWTDMKLASFSTFTNVLFQNSTSGTLNPIEINNVALISNPNPPMNVPNPAPDTAPVAAIVGQPSVTIQGLGLVDATNKTWLGRGVNICDLRGDSSATSLTYAVSAKEIMRRVDFAMANGVNFFRYLLETYTTAENVLGDPAYWTTVKSVISYILSKGAVVNASFWIDSSLSPTAGGQPTMSTAPLAAYLASSFPNAQGLLIGICNEPHGNGTASATDPTQTTAVLAYRNVVQQCITQIRQMEAQIGSVKHVIVVAGVDEYARNVSYWAANPLQDNQVLYACHVYNHATDWPTLFQAASTKIPVYIEEMGPAINTADSTGLYMTIPECQQLMQWCNTNGLPYTAWCFHQASPPNLLVDTSAANGGSQVGMTLTPTLWGAAFFAQFAATVVG